MNNKERCLRVIEDLGILNDVILSDDNYSFCFHSHYKRPHFSVWLKIDDSGASADLILDGGGFIVEGKGCYGDVRIEKMKQLINVWLISKNPEIIKEGV